MTETKPSEPSDEGSEVERNAWLLATARNVRAGLQKAVDYDDEVATIYNALRWAQLRLPPAQEHPASPNIVDTVNGYLKRAALEPHEPALDYVINAVLELAAAVQERRQ
jgi:hypothetical protein